MFSPEDQRNTAEVPQWQHALNQAVDERLGLVGPHTSPFPSGSVGVTCIQNQSKDRTLFFLLAGDIVSAISPYSQQPMHAIEEVMPANAARFAVNSEGEFIDPSPGWRRRYETFNEPGGLKTYLIDASGSPRPLEEPEGTQLASNFASSTVTGKPELFYASLNGGEGLNLLAQIIEIKVAEVSQQH